MTLTQTFHSKLAALKLKVQGLRLVTCRLWELEDLVYATGANIKCRDMDMGTVFFTDELHSETIDGSYHWIEDSDLVYRQWKIGTRNAYVTDMAWVTALVETSMIGAN